MSDSDPLEGEPFGDKILVHEVSDPDPQTVAELSPRHRRLCQLAAEGKTNNQICEELKYSQSRVSVLLCSPIIKDTIRKIQDRVFEEAVGKRLKQMVDPALANVEEAITDNRNLFKRIEKLEISKWLIEKIDGKAAQKIETSDSTLAALLDKLDALRASGQSLSPAQPPVIDVTPVVSPQSSSFTAEYPQGPLSPEPESEEFLTDWVQKNT